MRLVARSGPLTDELRREPGGFGLGQVPARLAPHRVQRLVCGFCSTGCSLDAHVRDGRAVNLSPTRAHPVNRGMACPKGWEALTPLAADERLTTPLLRGDDGRVQAVGWDSAVSEMVARIQAVQTTHGPEAAAFLSTGQIVTEEMAFLGALAKFGMGMRHGDGNTRQCMATSVVAHTTTFGFDAPPYTYADLEESDVVVLIGSNLAIAHPVLWQRLHSNPHDPAIVVIDPRHTETAQAATHHYGITPKSDLVLLYGLARLVIERGGVDEAFVAAHTTGFDEYRAHVDTYDLAATAAATGIEPDRLVALADLIAGGERVSLWWTMGVNQSHEGVLAAQAVIALALMTGNIGRPGTGANSITGQCNAMGSRLYSGTTKMLGGREWTDPGHRAEVADLLGIDAARIPHDGGWAYDRIVEGIHRGEIRALWVVATNGAHSWINQSEVRELLGRLDLLVVQDLYATTETAELADIVLPAAGWGEKSGTFINSERRVGLVTPVSPPPGEARTDFDIFRTVADAWGCGDLFAGWTDPEAVFRLLQRASAGRPCDISGIAGYEMLDAVGGVQWPYPAGSGWDDRSSERRLFADGRFFTPDGRARFIAGEPRPAPEPTSTRYPLVLLTGRGSSAQWHTQTRTGTSPILRSMHPAGAWVDIHPNDAATVGCGTGDDVVVESARGSMRARALVTPTVPCGAVFVPMHDPAVNRLTFPAFDPSSRQPSYKHCAVAVRRPEAWDA